ncbi:MAG: GDSL-type esterase/lipase family protein [Desulfobulbus sp.]|jgi:lysophospholipase L1-like esterase|uniref:GDSL-type esterase/lipase family protein n=1 Tax=Desulfobulbus sp. TaxID=895 RepID=UPI0028423D5C|nr:GDSL-type esterase/lipase family protein [Desulfobulbus sp.]MDR2551377.1 GDSL-type esterase/lipase family protein [Desulfobulbus sp.]
MIKLLMLGDSLVEWGNWSRHLPHVVVINRGIAGEMTEELSARLMDEIDDCPGPDAVLVQSGTNNLLMGYMFFPAIFSTMMQRLHACYPGVPLILCSLMPMPAAPSHEIEQVNRQLAEVAAATENCVFLDLVEPFFEQCLPITQPGFLADNVHLSTRGYQVWAGEIERCLQGLFPDSSRS